MVCRVHARNCLNSALFFARVCLLQQTRVPKIVIGIIGIDRDQHWSDY